MHPRPFALPSDAMRCENCGGDQFEPTLVYRIASDMRRSFVTSGKRCIACDRIDMREGGQ